MKSRMRLLPSPKPPPQCAASGLDPLWCATHLCHCHRRRHGLGGSDDPDNPVTPQTSELDGNRRLSKTTENHRLIAVSGHRRKLGHGMLAGSTDTFVEVTGELGQAHDVVTLSKVAFSTLDRDVASAAGLAALLTVSCTYSSILPHSTFPSHLLAYATGVYTRIHTAGRCIPRGAWQCALRARLQLRHGCGHHLGWRHTYAHRLAALLPHVLTYLLIRSAPSPPRRSRSSLPSCRQPIWPQTVCRCLCVACLQHYATSLQAYVPRLFSWETSCTSSTTATPN